MIQSIINCFCFVKESEFNMDNIMKKPEKPQKIEKEPQKDEWVSYRILQESKCPDDILFVPTSGYFTDEGHECFHKHFELFLKSEKVQKLVSCAVKNNEKLLEKFNEVKSCDWKFTKWLKLCGYDYQETYDPIDNYICSAAMKQFDFFQIYSGSHGPATLNSRRPLPKEEYEKACEDYRNRNKIYIEQVKLYNQEMEKYLEFKKQEKINFLKKQLEELNDI